MTETVRHFPRWTRAAVVAALLVLVSVVTTAAGAAPPSKEDVERAKHRLQVIEGALAQIQSQFAATQLRLNDAATTSRTRRSPLEKVTTDLLRTEARLERARARYNKIRERLNERAVTAYMTGPASSIDFLLDAQNVADLTDRLAYVDALAQSDAELSVAVANQKNLLAAAEATLADQQALALRELDKARTQKAEVAALFDQQQALLDEQQRLESAAERTFKKTKASYATWLAQQQSAGGQTMGGRVWDGGDLPEPYNHVLDACPVDQPRGFGDGFGAPRYAGGYHLHKGVDLVAPAGTADQGGVRRVFVHELQHPRGQGRVRRRSVRQGLQRPSVGVLGELERPVSAGDVIGYVGDTGDAAGLPHDHFEFHPNVMPRSWPKSYYGYSIIEDAINPYPLFVQACG